MVICASEMAENNLAITIEKENQGEKMSFYDNKDTSFGKIPHGWYHENKFFNKRSKILTHADRDILIFLTARIWRLERPHKDYPLSRLLSRLYNNGLLIAHIGQRDIVERTGYNRSTVIASIDKLEDYGAVIKLSGRKGKGFSNAYILGFENKDKDQAGKDKRVELLFSISPILKAGEKVPVEIRNFIRDNYNKDRKALFQKPVPPFDEYLMPLLFSPKSNLVSKQDDEIKLRKV